MFDLVQKLLAARKPSSNYSLFLTERLAFFQMKSIKEGRPYAMFKLLQKPLLLISIYYIQALASFLDLKMKKT
jgi:hypothetical protein